MDVEPIYCAEQIVVPPDLADILKAYTKEVIRRQPADLIEFSARYFANLADVAGSVLSDVSAPSRDQLKLVISRAAPDDTLSAAQVAALAKQANIPEAVVAKVFEAGKFSEDPLVDVARFVFLMLAMSCDSFSSLAQGLFEVFGDTGGSLSSDKFVTLIGFLAPEMDADFTPEMLASIRGTLKTNSVTLDDVRYVPQLKDKLGALAV